MDRSRSLLYIIGLVHLAFLFGCRNAGKEDASSGEEISLTEGAGEFSFGDFRDYNVILVSFDACRARSMSLYGNKNLTTPNLDQLAKDSIVFDRAISPSSWTVPATMSVFTGLWPSVHRVLNKYTVVAPKKMVLTRLNPAIPTIPEYLAGRGYRVVGYTGDAGVSGKFGYSRGFEEYLDSVKFGGFNQSIPAARKWLRKNKDSKFFMFLHGYDVHGQFDPPEGYRKIFVKDYKGKLVGGKEEQGELREKSLDNKFEDPNADEPYVGLTSQDFLFMRALYEEKIQDADRRFGEFLKTLDELGLREKTIIVVFADHGEEFGEHGSVDHGPTLYDEMIRVPLLFHIPGKKGRRIRWQVRTFDALPTVLDLLGLKAPFMTHAASLRPLLNGEKQPLVAFAETDYRLVTHKRAVCDAEGRYKFILTLENGKKELYDLKSDPKEKANIAKKETRIAYEMEQRLLGWMSSMNQDPATFRDRGESMIKEY